MVKHLSDGSVYFVILSNMHVQCNDNVSSLIIKTINHDILCNESIGFLSPQLLKSDD